MAEGEKIGTVTPLDSLFTSEEAEKAARQVAEAIADRQKELDCLRDFIADNSVLIHHVQKLPDELSHDIMVPFGGAAFFPGRLVHTNEFMVLLGEGYYAERSAKQTVEILQRRGISLEAHLESLKRTIKDLDAEAKFFESTAAEVAEGLVEIREEYVEENQKEPEKGSLGSITKPNNPLVPLETEVYLQKSPRSNIQSSSERIPSQIHKMGSRESKVQAFTGRVIEHSHGLSSSSPTNVSTSVQPSRPVSRFKMQKGSR